MHMVSGWHREKHWQVDYGASVAARSALGLRSPNLDDNVKVRRPRESLGSRGKKVLLLLHQGWPLHDSNNPGHEGENEAVRKRCIKPCKLGEVVPSTRTYVTASSTKYVKSANNG